MPAVGTADGKRYSVLVDLCFRIAITRVVNLVAVSRIYERDLADHSRKWNGTKQLASCIFYFFYISFRSGEGEGDGIG